MPGGWGLETAEVIQSEIFVLLSDYLCKSEEMHELPVPIDA
jgi:hypothetical protein